MHKLMKREAMESLEEVYDSNWLVMGQKLAEFEESYAQYIGTKHAVGVANGLDALEISLECLGVGPGDKVIVPSNTYIATWLAVSRLGAIPIPVEPDPEDCNIDVNILTGLDPTTVKAIIPVHLYGRFMPVGSNYELGQ